ncbi:hypothetical protein ACCQ05_20965 [Xanthomonas sp. NCPPB 3582]|uniref:hypothetical protein n=1 Tax=Xanthomonas sp. NCPPB 3582 TaxID=487557 RepID=UPI0035587566
MRPEVQPQGASITGKRNFFLFLRAWYPQALRFEDPISWPASIDLDAIDALLSTVLVIAWKEKQ